MDYKAGLEEARRWAEDQGRELEGIRAELAAEKQARLDLAVELQTVTAELQKMKKIALQQQREKEKQCADKESLASQLADVRLSLSFDGYRRPAELGCVAYASEWISNIGVRHAATHVIQTRDAQQEAADIGGGSGCRKGSVPARC